MKIEDAIQIMEKSLKDAERLMKNPKISKLEKTEARAAKRAYAHCIGLMQAVIEKKGWA
jgi:hypothetical protein